MPKITKQCPECKGAGIVPVDSCDKCGKEGFVGEYENDLICQDCWGKSLTPEEIRNL